MMIFHNFNSISHKGETKSGSNFARLTSNYAQPKSIAFTTVYAGKDSSVEYNKKVTVFLFAYQLSGSTFAGKVETRLSTSKIIYGRDSTTFNLGSTKSFVRLSYTSPTTPIPGSTTDEIIIRDNASKDVIHRIPILLH